MPAAYLNARTTLALIAGVLCLGAVALASGPNVRPDFAGKWSIIPDRSTPAGSSALGPTLTIEQTDTALTIARVSQITAMVKGLDGRDKPQTIERSTTNTYLFDGVERELATVASQMAGGRGGQGTLDLTSTYRAVWTTDQLVVMSFGRATAALEARTKGKDKVGQLKQVGRMSFSLDSDGTLIVDRVTALDPEAGGPKESAPVAFRSHYRKTS
jgi:hypothetical protein